MAWFAACCLGGAAGAEDVVFFASPQRHDAEIRFTGTIVDYRGDGLRIRLSDGKQRTLDASDVRRIQTGRLAAHVAGDEAFERGDLREAVMQYQAALKSEVRGWVGREIQAQLIRCHRELGNWAQAGELFLSLVSQDAQTPYFDVIPLVWKASEPRPEATAAAEVWFRRTQEPVTVLLAASHLLESHRRGVALAELRRLATSDDERIAALAQAQTWRATLATASEDRLDGWEAFIETMPERLRAGPYFLLGSACSQRGQHQRAALSLLRVPLQYGDQRTLGAHALFSAAQALETLGQENEATSLYRELAARFPERPESAAARRRLDAGGS